MSGQYETRDLKKGLKILHNGYPWVILDFQHVNPGKGAAFTRVKVRNLKTQQVLELSFKSGEKIEKPDVDERTMQFLYSDVDSYYFMDTKDYEQVSLTQDEVGDSKYFLIENGIVSIVFFNSKPIGIETGTFVELKVKETPPGIKGNTATGGSKPATLETGLVVSVPFHINEGDILRIDTRERTYVDRVQRK